MKMRKHEGQMSSNDERIVRLETIIENINSSLVEIKQDIHRLADKVDNNFKWLIGTIITLFLITGMGTILSILLKH